MSVHRARSDLRVPGPQVPGLVSGVTLVLGCWLVVQSIDSVYGPSAVWNDRLTGAAATVLGLARATRMIRLSTATAVGLAIGLWLVVAPLVLDYGFIRDSTTATLTDAAAGATILVLTMIGHLRAIDPETRRDTSGPRD
ncbi:MAG: hypothetical protein M3548_14035 [Actinomycetota bacterium]|nr:hypothetical protein [Actinomycetota bacterium]